MAVGDVVTDVISFDAGRVRVLVERRIDAEDADFQVTASTVIRFMVVDRRPIGERLRYRLRTRRAEVEDRFFSRDPLRPEWVEVEGRPLRERLFENGFGFSYRRDRP